MVKNCEIEKKKSVKIGINVKMKRVYEPFPIPIIQTVFNIDNETIKEFCLEQEQNTPGVMQSNVGGYQSPNLQLDTPELAELMGAIEWSLNEYIEDLIYPPPLSVVNMWFNINYYKDTNAPHLHPHSVYSGAYYVQTPKDCGKICFQHPALDLLYHYQTEGKDALFKGDAIERGVYLFPSWLKHFVRPNMNIDQQRISISFNIQGPNDIRLKDELK